MEDTAAAAEDRMAFDRKDQIVNIGEDCKQSKREVWFEEYVNEWSKQIEEKTHLLSEVNVAQETKSISLYSALLNIRIFPVILKPKSNRPIPLFFRQSLREMICKSKLQR